MKSILNDLYQGLLTGGPWAACGMQLHFVRPTNILEKVNIRNNDFQYNINTYY